MKLFQFSWQLEDKLESQFSKVFKAETFIISVSH